MRRRILMSSNVRVVARRYDVVEENGENVMMLRQRVKGSGQGGKERVCYVLLGKLLLILRVS